MRPGISLHCSVCTSDHASVGSLHLHQMSTHTTEELSLALLSLRGLTRVAKKQKLEENRFVLDGLERYPHFASEDEDDGDETEKEDAVDVIESLEKVLEQFEVERPAKKTLYCGEAVTSPEQRGSRRKSRSPQKLDKTQGMLQQKRREGSPLLPKVIVADGPSILVTNKSRLELSRRLIANGDCNSAGETDDSDEEKHQTADAFEPRIELREIRSSLVPFKCEASCQTDEYELKTRTTGRKRRLPSRFRNESEDEVEETVKLFSDPEKTEEVDSKFDDFLSHAGHQERRFFCETCKKGYKKKSHLERHLRVHTGERPYICDHCGKKFAVRSVLKQHVRIHTGEKPFACSVCDQRFPQKSGLMTHMMLHTGKPFKCDRCDKAFVSNHKLINHLNSHLGERPFNCAHCNTGFFTEALLTEHLKIHSRERTFVCRLCNASFIHEVYLKVHIEEHVKKPNGGVDEC